MKSLKSIGYILFLSFFLAIGCQNEPPLIGAASYIPANSTAVTGFDIQRIMSKAEFESVKQMDFYSQLVENAGAQNELLSIVLMDPAKSGINVSSKMYVVNAFENLDSSQINTQLLFDLADLSAFEELFQSLGIEFESNNRIKYHKFENNVIIAWNDEVVTITSNSDIDKTIAALTKQDGQKNLTGIGGFATAMNSDHDVVSWLSSSTLADNPNLKMATTFLDLDKEIFQDNYVHTYMDLEKGKIQGHVDFHVKEEIGKDLVGNIFKNEASTDYISIVPTEGLSMAVTASLNYKGIDRFLSERPMTREKVDFFLNNIGGFERKKIIEAFNGDILLANYSSNDGQGKEDFLVAVAFKDKATASKMLDEAVKNKKLKEIEENYYKVISVGGEDFQITVNKGLAKILQKDGMLIYSPNEELLLKINRGELGNKSGSPRILNEFKNNSVNGWADLTAYQGELGKNIETPAKSIQFSANSEGADFIIESVDGDTNILKSLFEAINLGFLEAKGKNNEML